MEGLAVSQSSSEPLAKWLSETSTLKQRFEAAHLPLDLIRPAVDRPRLAAWLQTHPDSIPAFVRALFPLVSIDPEEYALENYRQAIAWVRWAMLGCPGDVPRALSALLDEGGPSTGACGTQWGENDIAYRCRDCELDPTCAVCVSCFLAGDHKEHDYQMIKTGGGCCDCGDPTAWRREGFCPHHQGPSGETVKLPEDFVKTATPVLRALLEIWVERLDVASKELDEEEYYGKEDVVTAAEGTSHVVARELLELCNKGEALLRFVGGLVGDESLGLLSVLMRSGRALDTEAETEVHALLYKLLGDPDFKYNFAKVFVQNYALFNELRAYPLIHLAGFSVQIFTVPTLTPRLVLEDDLLDILLATLRDVVRHAIGRTGRLEVSHSSFTSQQYSRVLSDLRYVLSSPAVAGYAAVVRPELARSFVHFLAFPQGMLPHVRRTGTHVEMESEAWRDAVMLETELAMHWPLIVDGAKGGRGAWDEFVAGMLENERGKGTGYGQQTAAMQLGSKTVEGDALPTSEGATEGKMGSRKGKEKAEQGGEKPLAGASPMSDEGGLPEEQYKEQVMGSLAEMTREMAGTGQASADFFAVMVGMLVEAGTPSQPRDPPAAVGQEDVSDAPVNGVPASLVRLIAVCAGVLATWIEIDQVREARRLAEKSAAGDLDHRRGQLERLVLVRAREVRETRRSARLAASRKEAARRLPGLPEVAGLAGPSPKDKPALTQGQEPTEEPVEWVALAESESWPDIQFDVSTQPVSFHLPLHRFLAQCFRGSVECTEGGSGPGFLRALLPAKYQGSGFPAAVMEHVLQLQVLNAQIRAGMWRRNGGNVLHLSGLYTSNYWCEDSLNLDVFLLQCCAVLAPADDFVWRVVQRFNLEGYLAPGPLKHEYEPQLAEALLALLVRIVAERGLSGLDEKRLLRRELVQRLAWEDATFSALSKALPPKLRESKHVKDSLRAVATFIKPTGLEPGKFALKESCWHELDSWALSWDRIRLQEAEERFFRATNKSAPFALLPKWVPPFPAFSSLSNIATSGAVHNIITAVLREAEGASRKVTDNVLHAALHLLALALDTCQKVTGPTGQSPFVRRVVDGLRRGSGSGDPADASGSLVKGPSLIELLVRLRGQFLQRKGEGHVGKNGENEAAGMVEGFLRSLAALDETIRRMILALEPGILSDNAKASESGPALEAEKKRRRAKARQAAMMASMRAAQAKFAASMAEESEAEPAGQPEAATCVLCRAPGGEAPLCHVVLGQRSRVVAWARRPLPDWREGIHTEGGPDSSGPYSRLGPIGDPLAGVIRQDVMGPGGRMLVDTNAGAIWMNEAEVMDLDEDDQAVADMELEALLADRADELLAVPIDGQAIPPALAGEAGVGAPVGDIDLAGAEGAAADADFEALQAREHGVLLEDVIAGGPTVWHVVHQNGEVGLPGPHLLNMPGEWEEGGREIGDWEMGDEEDDEPATLEEYLETIGFEGDDADHDTEEASGDGDEQSNEGASPVDANIPTEQAATVRRAEGGALPPAAATAAEHRSGGSEPGPAVPPQDEAGPSNPTPAAAVGGAGPGPGSQPRERLAARMAEPGTRVHATLAAIAASALHDNEAPDRVIEMIIEQWDSHALRQPQAGTANAAAGGSGADAAARPTGPSAPEEGIPQVDGAVTEEVGAALQASAPNTSADRTNEPDSRANRDPGAVLGQELEWLRAVAGDGAAVSGPSDSAMRALVSKYIMFSQTSSVPVPEGSLPVEDGVGLHFRACGHAIHAKCLEGYFQSLYQSGSQRELFEGVHIVNLEAGEFLCPVCRRLANAALPVLPATPKNAPLTSPPVEAPGPAGVPPRAASEAPGAEQTGPSSSPREAPSDAPNAGPGSRSENHTGGADLGTPIEDYVRPAVKLILGAEGLTIPVHPHGLDASYWNFVLLPQHGAELGGVVESFAARVAWLSGRVRPTHGLDLWEALAYTVQATELAARRVAAPLDEGLGDSGRSEPSGNDMGAETSAQGASRRVTSNQSRGAGSELAGEPRQAEIVSPDVIDYVSKRLEALGATAAEGGRSVLRPLTDAARALRRTNRVEQLFRARGMQILAGALLRGQSRDEIPSEMTSGVSERLAGEMRFWRLLADPVLFHDPFPTLVRLLYVLSGDLPDAEGIKALIRFLHLVLLEQVSSDLLPDPASHGANAPPTIPEPIARLRKMGLPFLRQSALLLEALHPGSVPSFRSPAGAAERAAAAARASRARAPAPADVMCELVESAALEADLGFAPLERMLEGRDLAGPARVWRRHFQAEADGWRGSRTYLGEPGARSFQLMQLPRNYHELFQRYVKAKCRQCKTIPAQPVLCLICGAFLCGHARNACCRVNNRSECFRHAAECGLGIGVFLFLRRTTVTLLRNGRLTVWLSPYLDAHGEEDNDLRRGKPLFLSEERYTALTQMVASMGMDHDSQVLARTVRRSLQAIE